MPKLTADVQAFIVTALASHDTPSQVAESVKDEFGLDLDRQQIEAYNPTKVQGKNLSKQWRDLFKKTREEFDGAVSAIPIAKKAYRLRTMQRIVARAEKNRNMVLALQTLEQAAKEVGDAYVNRQRAGDEEKDAPAATKVERSVKDARRQ